MEPLRRSRARTAAALVAGLTLALAACGGGSSDGASGGSEAGGTPTTTPAETTTTEATTTTTEVPEADADTVALVEASQFTAEDLGEGWKRFADGEDDERDDDAEADECLDPADGELAALPDGARATGAIFEYGDEPIYVRSNVAVLPDEETAEDLIAFLATDEYQECLRADVEESNRPESGDYAVADGTTDEMRATVGSQGTEDVALFEGSVDGELQSQIYLTTYRIGRAVVWVQLDVGGTEAATLDQALTGEAAARGTTFERAAGAQGIAAPS